MPAMRSMRRPTLRWPWPGGFAKGWMLWCSLVSGDVQIALICRRYSPAHSGDRMENKSMFRCDSHFVGIQPIDAGEFTIQAFRSDMQNPVRADNTVFFPVNPRRLDADFDPFMDLRHSAVTTRRRIA